MSGKGPLRIAIEDFLVDELLGNLIRGGVTKFIEDYERDLVENNQELISFLLNNPNLPPEIRAFLRKNFSTSSQASIVGLIAMALGAVVSIVLGMLGPVSRSGEHVVDGILRTNRMSPDILIPSIWRVGPQSDRGYGDLYDLGWSAESIQRFEAILEPQVAESDLMRLYHRFDSTRGFVRSELSKRGWSGDNIERLIEASKVYPGLQDLVTMAVREVYNPGQRQALGLDSDFPSEFGRRAEQLGVDPEYARDYWAAHWQLPSLQMGFEMLHRLRPGRSSNPVTIGIIDDLIKAQDYSPTWRNRLREISYTPLTRVDIRRIYATGGMSKEDVYEAYLDLGYDETNARRLADFATLETTGSGKDLTRSAIQNGYGKGLFTYNEAIELLIGLGYSEDEANYWLIYEDYQKQEKLDKLRTSVIELRFMAGEIDRLSAQNELINIGFPNDYVQNLLEEWRLQLAKRIKVPTKAELEDLYEANIISFEQMADYMIKRGYSNEVAGWLIALIDIRVEEKRQKELERAQKEQERLIAAENNTDYQLDKAQVDVEIAEWKAYISDLKLAQHTVTDVSQLDLIKEEIDRVKTLIARLNLQKANLKTNFLEEQQ